jgi:hypothetical protein
MHPIPRNENDVAADESMPMSLNSFYGACSFPSCKVDIIHSNIALNISMEH